MMPPPRRYSYCLRTYLTQIAERSGQEWSELRVTLVEKEDEQPYLELEGSLHKQPVRLEVEDLGHEVANRGILRVRSVSDTTWGSESIVFGAASTIEEVARLRHTLAHHRDRQRFGPPRLRQSALT